MRFRVQTPAPLILICGVALAGWALEASGLRFNTSPSVPAGLYRIDRASIATGGLVAACLPETEGVVGRKRGYLRRGRCPGGASPVIKLVGAVSGDLVRVTTNRILVNGRRLQGPPPSVDSHGRPLRSIPAGDYQLGPGELWLYSPYPKSWDSRFFGPIPRSAVLGSVRPIWTKASDSSVARPGPTHGNPR